MILPESRLTTLRFARTYFARAPATRTSVHVKSATPMHRGCITDLLCKSVTFTKTCGGRSSANVRQISVVGTIDSINIISGACKVNASVAHFARRLLMTYIGADASDMHSACGICRSSGLLFKANGCDPLLPFPEKLPSLLY